MRMISMSRILLLLGVGVGAVLASGDSALAGVKTYWTIDTYNTYINPSPESLIRSQSMVISYTFDRHKIYVVGGPYSALYQKGSENSPTGNFGFTLVAADKKHASAFIGVWDTLGTPQLPGVDTDFRATFETEAHLKVGESQRLFFTQGDASRPGSVQYLVMMKLEKIVPCDEKNSCFTP